MSKLNSYQKLKKENAALTKDIITLIENKVFWEVHLVKTKWNFKLSIEKAIWEGDTQTDEL